MEIFSSSSLTSQRQKRSSKLNMSFKPPFRVGFGYDIHPLVKGEGIILGGVRIPCHYKTEAHSDGDVVYHALGEAILGSLSLNDIGTYFPNSLEETKGMDSSKIFLFALDKAYKMGYKISNIDISVITEEPELKDYVKMIKENIADVGGLESDQVSFKAGTNEKIDGVGHKEAIICYANVSLYL